MRPGLNNPLRRALMLASLVALGTGPIAVRGDEPRGLGRLFRFGSNAPSSRPEPRTPSPGPRPDVGAPPPSSIPSPPPSLLPGPGTPDLPDTGPAPRLRPQPRVSRAVTESDPLVTRISLGKTDDGKTFGMFLQVFADGTVIDSEGVHRVGADLLRPVAQAIQSGDLSRLKGHCGGPPNDYIEQHHVVVYERSLGRLRAIPFSYSGNPQGCDPAVRHLQAAIDAIQTKVSSPAMAADPAVPASASPVPATSRSPFGFSTDAPPPASFSLSPPR